MLNSTKKWIRKLIIQTNYRTTRNKEFRSSLKLMRNKLLFLLRKPNCINILRIYEGIKIGDDKLLAKCHKIENSKNFGGKSMFETLMERVKSIIEVFTRRAIYIKKLQNFIENFVFGQLCAFKLGLEGNILNNLINQKDMNKISRHGNEK